MKLNPSVTHSFSVLLLVLLLLVGCGEAMTGPEIATVKVEFTLPPSPPTPSVDGPICKAGDILQPGESCFYPGTNTTFSVYDDAAQFLYANAGESITMIDTRINNQLYTLRAYKRRDKSWIIEEVGDAGDAGSLDVIISTDFTQKTVKESIYDEETSERLKDLGIPTERTTTKFIYNTKDEFSLTESFEQDFPLDPDDTRLAVEIKNNTPHDLSVHLTVRVDGEVKVDERESFTSRSISRRWWTWSQANE